MKTCYFAYTWNDDDLKLPKFLEKLKDMVETYSEGQINVIYDKKSFKLGDNFEKKEDLIYKSDSIVIFFSPNYKNIIDNHDENKGVYREYKKILSVREKNIASIIPVIVNGNERNAITSDFRRNIAKKIDTTNIFTKALTIKKKCQIEVEDLVGKIIKETNLAYKKRDCEFKSTDDMMEILFGESESNEKLPHKCMYETSAYRSVLSQNRRYIIGRKGSGKTTFFELLEKYDVEAFENKFKVLRPIKAEKINMEYSYSILNFFNHDNSVFSLNSRLELFWEIYTYICAIYIICLEAELFKVEDERRFILKEAGDIFRKEKLNIDKLDNDKCHEALFISAIDTFNNFFSSKLVEYGKESSYFTSLVANYNVDNVMIDYFGEDLYEKLKNAIMKCKKKVMIALDGFDRVSEHFRESTINFLNSNNEDTKQLGRDRLYFESLFFRSMFNVFEKLRKTQTGIISKVSFCIIIPQDRLDQIKEKDRDFSKYNFASLSWDAIDLLQMLVKRLEFVYGEVDSTDIVEKFEIIMKKNFKTIPLTIKIRIDGKDAEMSLFEYLLRISFWRPRDIIKYFYEIYLANLNNIKSKDALTSDTIKSILYSKASDIIESEFYIEYRSVITNIEEIMENFRGKNILLDLEEVYEILSRQPFVTSAIREFNKPYNKLKMLYELSVLGIWVDRSVKTKEDLKCHICFNYNEGLHPIDILKNNRRFEKEEVKIIINPIFSKYLSLKYNTKEVLEDYGWEYLFENHTRKSAIKRI